MDGNTRSPSSSGMAPALSDEMKNKTSSSSSPHHGRKRKKGGSKPKMTKEERRAKYTAIAHNRRDANIARARDKHLICYRCRKTGHSAENCTNSAVVGGSISGHDHDHDHDHEGKKKKEKITKHSIKKGTTNNICYKCGSTEHRIQACPKIKPFLPSGGKKNTKIDFGKLGDLPYANCFVCNKSGHLASHCPESTKGLYPQGGSCRECGSVYHFASDCPEKEKKKRKKHGSDGRGEEDVSHASSSDSVIIDQFLEEEEARVEEPKMEKKPKKRKIVKF